MRDYIELRAIEVGKYIIDSKATVRKTATKFGVSKSTGCGEGIAIPHAIIKEIDEVQLFIVRFRYPIEWESFDDKKVDIAFAIIAPEEKGQEKYLVFLSRLARKLVDEKFIADFRNCRSTEAVYQYVKNELE